MTDVTVTLIDGGFERHTLACPGGPYFLGTDSGLWGTSPARIETERVAGVDGATLRQVSSDPKTLAVPVRIGAEGEQLTSGEVQNRFHQLMDRLNATDSCRLEVERPGVHREIEVRYQRGAAVDDVAFRYLDYPTLLVNLEFLALDPVWRNVVNPESSYPTTVFDNAYFGGSDEITIVNASTVPVSPRFIFEGEVENIEVMNATTGVMFRMIEEMQSQTDRMIVETDPRSTPGAYLNGGPREWWFDGFSRLEDFTLVPGENILFLSGLSNTAVTLGAFGTFAIEWTDLFDQC